MSERQHRVSAAEGLISKLKRLASLWGDGKTDAEIAEILGWGRETVKNYRQVLRLIDPNSPAWRKKPAGRWRDRPAAEWGAP